MEKTLARHHLLFSSLREGGMHLKECSWTMAARRLPRLDFAHPGVTSCQLSSAGLAACSNGPHGEDNLLGEKDCSDAEFPLSLLVSLTAYYRSCWKTAGPVSL